jgi:hypothetical protein
MQIRDFEGWIGLKAISHNAGSAPITQGWCSDYDCEELVKPASSVKASLPLSIQRTEDRRLVLEIRCGECKLTPGSRAQARDKRKERGSPAATGSVVSDCWALLLTPGRRGRRQVQNSVSADSTPGGHGGHGCAGSRLATSPWAGKREEKGSVSTVLEEAGYCLGTVSIAC